jgi:hypothetical protein
MSKVALLLTVIEYGQTSNHIVWYNVIALSERSCSLASIPLFEQVIIKPQMKEVISLYLNEVRFNAFPFVTGILTSAKLPKKYNSEQNYITRQQKIQVH